MSGQGSSSRSKKPQHSFKARIQERYQRIYERERSFILGINTHRLERWLRVSFVLFFSLYLLDVFSTFIALRFLPAIFERNLLFATLFASGFEGYVVAVFLKFLVILPIATIVFLPSYDPNFELMRRILKIAALAGVVAAIIIYSYIVLLNNLPILISNL